jgi:hypothetical protein
VGLFDDAEQRSRIRNGYRATLGPAAEVLEQKLELLGEIFRRCELFGDFARGVTGQDKSVIALSLEQNSFENVLPEVDADNRIAAPRHGGVLHIAGSVPTTPVFCPR